MCARKDNSREMTGTIMGVTTVPLPAFWSSSNNEGDQLRRSPRKEHPCQNPRCAANNMDCGTLYQGPPTKRIEGSFKSVRPNNFCPVKSSNGTPRELENCRDIKSHGSHTGKYADCIEFPSPPRPTAKPLRESCSVNSHKGSTGINCKEYTRWTGINSKKSSSLTGINPKKSTILTRIILNESTRSAGLNSKELARSTGINSRESAMSISSSSHAPSISTPIRCSPKPSKTGLVPLSVQKESTSTGSSSPGCSQGTSVSLPTSRLSESMERYIADENLAPSCLRSGSTAPPNSERDEEEVPVIEELDPLKPSLTLPQFDEPPVGALSTSRWPPLPTDIDPNIDPLAAWPKTYAPTSICGLTLRSSIPPPWSPPWPADIDPGISRAVNMASNNDSLPSNVPPTPLSGFPTTMPAEPTTIDIRVMPMRCSSPTTASKFSEGHSGCGFCQGTPISPELKCRRAPAVTKSRESDVSTRSSTTATMSNVAQMCILEQRLEEEDHTSNSSSLTTVGSDSPKESCSTEVGSSLRGANPVSAFYNALYAPDCTLSGTKALEAHLNWQKRTADLKLRVAIEIAMLSAMVTILVVMLYPAVTGGFRSPFYGCCSCPAAPPAATSRIPRQHLLKWYDGCVYRGQNLWQCPPDQRTTGSTVVK